MHVFADTPSRVGPRHRGHAARRYSTVTLDELVCTIATCHKQLDKRNCRRISAQRAPRDVRRTDARSCTHPRRYRQSLISCAVVVVDDGAVRSVDFRAVGLEGFGRIGK